MIDLMSLRHAASTRRPPASLSHMLARVLRTPLLMALMATAATCLAQPQPEEDFNDRDKPWQETAVELPDAPRSENLMPFFVSASTTQSFAIDAKSLSVGADGVIRYTLVATSQAGAVNISHEGIRCATHERKLYAFGRPDGSWSRSRRDQWDPIGGNLSNRQHAALARDYFCEGKSIAGNAEDLIDRIRRNKTLAPL